MVTVTVKEAKLNSAGTGVIVSWGVSGDCGWNTTITSVDIAIYDPQGRYVGGAKGVGLSGVRTVSVLGYVLTSGWSVIVYSHCSGGWGVFGEKIDEASVPIDTTEFNAAQEQATPPIAYRDGVPICQAPREYSTALKACVIPSKVTPPPGPPFEIPWVPIVGGITAIAVLWLLFVPPKGKEVPRIVPITKRVIVPAGRYAVAGVKRAAKGVAMLPEAFRGEEVETGLEVVE